MKKTRGEQNFTQCTSQNSTRYLNKEDTTVHPSVSFSTIEAHFTHKAINALKPSGHSSDCFWDCTRK